MAKPTDQGIDEQTPARQLKVDIDIPKGKIRNVEISRLICGGEK